MSGKLIVDREVPAELWHDVPTFRLWSLLIRRAAYADCEVEGRTVRRGQYIRSTRKLRDDLAYTENRQRHFYGNSTIQRSLDSLVKMGLIELGADPGARPGAELGALITIRNYEAGQSFSEPPAGTSGGTRGRTRGGTSGKKDQDNKTDQDIKEGHHPSPNAPKHLSRKPDELVPVPDPEEPGAVWMTWAEWESFAAEVGDHCACKLCDEMTTWAKNEKAKYRKRVDHYETLLNWHRRKLADGYEFFHHPQHGPNYYRNSVIRDVNRQQGRI